MADAASLSLAKELNKAALAFSATGTIIENGFAAWLAKRSEGSGPLPECSLGASAWAPAWACYWLAQWLAQWHSQPGAAYSLHDFV